MALFVRQSFPQEPPCENRKLPVSFRDAQNLPVQGVSLADLEAKAKGKPIKLISLEPDTRPHRVILLMDISASMGSSTAESPLWDLEVPLAKHFFETNKQSARIALLFFNDHVSDVVDFAQGNAAVGRELQKVATDRDFAKSHLKGKTALRDAILRGIELLDHPNSADAIFVISDGGDNSSTQSVRDISERLAVSSARLFAILVTKDTPYRSRAPEEVMGPEELAEITRKSGGEILSAAEWHNNHVTLSADHEAKLKV